MLAGPVFIGRQAELGLLRAALGRAVAGEGNFVALVGEAGLGKTRTAAELAQEAQALGAVVLWGRCHAGDVAPAFWPWVQVIRSYSQQRPSAAAEGLASALRDAPMADLASPRLGAPSGLARFELFDRVVTFLRGEASRQPLVLIFDDLHWGDRSSLLLLEFAVRELLDAAVLFVGAYSGSELAQFSDVAELLGNLTRLGITLELRGLTRAEMGAVVQQSFTATLSDEFVAAVHQATDGNPFFALEVVRLLSPEDVLAARTARRAAALPIPVGIRETIRHRLAPLPATSREILCAAAVLGREFDLMPLEQVLAMPAERLLEALAPALAADLVRSVPEGLRRYAFVHALVREQLYDDIPLTQRATLHRQAGEAIESIAGDVPEVRAAELAHHFFEAARSGDSEKAVAYGRQAGMRALALSAYDEAVHELERAFQAATLVPGTSADARVELLLGLAQARHGAGDLEAAETVSRAAVDLARTCGPRRFAEAAAQYAEVRQELAVVDEGMLGLLEDALGALSTDEERLRALLLAKLAASSWLRPGTGHRRRELADEAMSVARRLGDLPTLIYVLSHRLVALLGPDTLAQRVAAENEVIQLAERSGKRSAALGAFTLRIHDLVELGDRRGLDQAIEECERHAATQGHPFYLWQASNVRTMVALLEGRWLEAEALANETLAAGQTVQPRSALVYFTAQLLKLRAETGRVVEVAPLVETAAAQVAAVPASHSVLADVYGVLGRTDDARRELDLLAANDFAGVPRDATWLVALCLAANACVQLADRRRAEVLFAMLLPYRDRIATVPPAIVALSPVAHHLGQLATLLGLFDEAAGHLDHALALAERMRGVPWVAHAEQAYAALLVARRGPGDRRRALSRLERARRIGEERGMVLLLERVAATRSNAEALPSDEDEPAAKPMFEAAEREEVASAVGEALPVAGRGAASGSRSKVVQLATRPVPSERHRSTFGRAGDLWTISHAGRVIRLKHAVGLAHIALLLQHPRQQFHVNDLLAHVRHAGPSRGDMSVAAATGAGLSVRADLGDAGAMLDPEAKGAYRRRLAELREELEDATTCNDIGRSEHARQEIEFISRELEQSMGLGGRDRRAVAAAERARVTVAKAIKFALGKIAEQDAAVADHLRRAVRTGYVCAYEPAAGDPIVWDV